MKSLGWRCFKMVFIWFRYDLLLGFVSGLVLQFMILIWFQLWCWHGSTLWFWWAKSVNTYVYIYIYYKFLKTYQNHIRQNHIKIASASTSHQNRIKTVSKSYQNNSKFKPLKKTQNWPKTCPWAVSISFLEANPLGTLKKVLRSQTMSKPYQNHIQRSTTISKP